jgi:hypothetical protein
MVELADTLALGASAARHAGSSPVPGTILLEARIEIEILNRLRSSNCQTLLSGNGLPASSVPSGGSS